MAARLLTLLAGLGAALLPQPAAAGCAPGDVRQFRVVEQSSPAGIVEADYFVTICTTDPPALRTIATSVAPQYSGPFAFHGWTINGVRSADVLLRAQNPASVLLTQDITAVANYLPASQDLDDDGLSDWWEQLFVADDFLEPPDNAESVVDAYLVGDEFRTGLHPLLRESRVDGGISRARSAAMLTALDTSYVLYRERSEPRGFFASETMHLVGGGVLTTTAAQTSNGQRFSYWSLNGSQVQTRDSLGVARNPVLFIIFGSTDAVATYLPETLDTDADGLPDWWELGYFGATTGNSGTDTDADGYDSLSELRFGLNPRLDNTRIDGGISRYRSASIGVPLQMAYSYLITSTPNGSIGPDIPGTALPTEIVTTPEAAEVSASGLRFGYWDVNAQRQVDALGVALHRVARTLTVNSTFTAHYYDPALDSDADALPDWFEERLGGAIAPADNDDNDAYDALAEFRYGLSPKLRDTRIDGGISRYRSAPAVIDFRPFPRVREVLVAGLPQGFFSSAPDAAGTIGATFKLDANTAPALGDWDGDGDADLFVVGTSGGSPTLRVYRNGGSSVVISWERETTLEAALASSLAGIATPSLSLGDVDADGRADLAVGGTTGTVKVLKSPGNFTAAPSTLATIATGDASAVPGFADTSGDGRPELVSIRPDGSARAYTHSGNENAPYSDATFTANVLPGNVLQATSVSSADVTEDGNPDIVVSDAAGSLWEFHRQGAGFALVSRIFGGTGQGYANRLAGAVGDLDGDGDGDVVAGFAEGGLVYLRNQVAKLAIEPTVKTLVAGQGQTFTVRDPGPPRQPVPPITWRFVANRSGGTLSATGVYASGNQSRRVDIIEAEDARGVTGRTYVNVIDAADQTQAGKVLIVAGGKATNDAIWAATRTTANRMYRAFLHRGYRKEDIRYLSLAYGEALEPADRQAANDLDGNGIANDELFGLPITTNVEQSLTQWASTAADLVVVLIDHGENQVFTLKGSETLSASTLDGYLDALQGGATDVTVIMDYCFAGSFLPGLSTPAGKERILLAAAAANERSSLFQGGEVSFSQGVARGVFQGFDLERTFLQAAETMAQHQSGQLDDDGSGTYTLADGAQARTKTLGPIFIVGQDIPVIETVTATVPSPDGVTEIATLGAEGSAGIISVHPLQRVWCTIEAPNARTDPAQPLANLPEVPLVLDPDTGTYRARAEGFTESGTYQVSCYVRDIHNSVSFPATTQVVRAQAHDARLVIVVAGETNAPEWTSARAIGDATYQTARARGYLPSQIYYLTRGSAPQQNACTSGCTPTTSNLGTALTSNLAMDVGAGTAQASELTLVLIGSGGTGLLVLGTGDTLSASQLDGWLDAFQDGLPGAARPVNVLVDHGDDACTGQGTAYNLTSPATCNAQSLLTQLAPQGNETRRDRAVFMSSGSGQPNVRLANGTLSFAQLLLSHALENRAFGDALQAARGTLDLVTRPTGTVQRPYFDVTSATSLGNPGTPNETSDLRELRNRFLGGLVRTTAPRTVGVPGRQVPVGTATTIAIKGEGNPLRTLTAIVTAPDDPGRVASPRQVTAQSLAMAYNATTDRYETTYTPTTPGEHTIVIVETTQGLQSVPEELTLVANGNGAGVSLTSAAQTVAEGQALTITATLSQPAAQMLAVPFTLTGNADLQVDYDVSALAFVFPQGATNASVQVTVASDAGTEADETLVLALGEASGVIVSLPTETRITITNVGAVPPGLIFANGFE